MWIIVIVYRLRGLAVACWTTDHYQPGSNLGVGIPECCFIFDFTSNINNHHYHYLYVYFVWLDGITLRMIFSHCDPVRLTPHLPDEGMFLFTVDNHRQLSYQTGKRGKKRSSPVELKSQMEDVKLMLKIIPWRVTVIVSERHKLSGFRTYTLVITTLPSVWIRLNEWMKGRWSKPVCLCTCLFVLSYEI